MIKIENPILPGFNADPSAIRVGDDYYVITSTFNWLSGVSLYHSKDLKNWKLVDNILNRESQLDLRGNPDSCGIWAPQISYNHSTKLFYMCYTDVKNLSNSFFDLNNYLVTAKDILGPWSEPVYLNSSGFDPSLFHDDDGKSYLLNLAWEFRDNYPHPGPIIIQEFNTTTNQLIGESRVIYNGNSHFGCTEGPHMYKKDGFYYLLTAEGGTGYGHAVKFSRSENIYGSYKESPFGPLITSRANPDPELPKPSTDFLKPQFYNPGVKIQKAGHGSIIETVDGEFALFHLAARPLQPSMRCTLNRETFIQKIQWKDGWPVMSSGSHLPEEIVTFSHNEVQKLDVTEPGRVDFNSDALPKYFYSLKNYMNNSWCSLSRKKGVLSIKGRNSPYSAHDLSLVARRVQHFNCSVETEMDFKPENCREMAGLVIQTGSATFYYLRYYYSETLQSQALGLFISRNGVKNEESRTKLPYNGPIKLKLLLNEDSIEFYFAKKDEEFTKIGYTQDATILSDEFTNMGPGAFDGTFVGLTAHDMNRQQKWAEFRYFEYNPVTQ